MKIYRDQYSLFTPRENTKIEKIADLENVVQRQSNSIKRTTEIEQARIIVVSNFSTFSRCISCRDGCVLPVGDDEPFGRCTECSTALRMDSCPKHTSALLMLESSEECSVKLLALNNQLSQIADLPLEDVTDVTLLSADQFKAVYSSVQYSKRNR